MRTEQLGTLTARITGGVDGHGGGTGPVVVLLHGWAAPGEDLVPLSHAVPAPEGTRFVFPEGPLSVDPEVPNGRAWWRIDVERLNEDLASGRPRNLSREVPPGLSEARGLVVALLEAVEARLCARPERVVLGGFSQGAMLACDVVLRTDRPFAGIALLSGTVLARDEWVPLMPKRKGLRMLQTHGRGDVVLPFFLAEQLRDLLTEAGVRVEWIGFEGGHEIPEHVAARLGEFCQKTLA